MRKLFKGGNYSRAETIWGNTVCNSDRMSTKAGEDNREKKYTLFQLKVQYSQKKYWYYFHGPKNVVHSTLTFVFWIFLPLDTAVQLDSVDSKHNTISKIFFRTFLEQWEKHIILSEKSDLYFILKVSLSQCHKKIGQPRSDILLYGITPSPLCPMHSGSLSKHKSLLWINLLTALSCSACPLVFGCS